MDDGQTIMRGISGRTLCGRSDALARLDAALAELVAGGPRLVLVSGEPGIGKSLLLDEWLKGIPAGVRVARGFGLPGEGFPPFFALGRALPAAVAATPGVVSPEVLAVLVGAGVQLGLPGPTGEAVALDPDTEWLRLLDAFVAVFEGLATDMPLILVLDDMQWAARADWDVLAYASRVARSPLLIVVAARDEGLWWAPSPALAALSEVTRQGRFLQIDLGPLDEISVADLCESMLDGVAAPALKAWLFGASGGNPFYLGELLKAGVERGLVVLGEVGWDLAGAAATEQPISLQMAIDQRLLPLPPATRQILEAAAVMGRVVDPVLLSAVVGTPQSDLLQQLAPATRAGILVNRSGGIEFRHDLIRERLAATASNLSELHRRAAEALQCSAGIEADPATLAYHYRRAGDLESASRASLAAVSVARRARAAGDALAFARDAVSAAGEVGGGLYLEALQQLGEAALEAGDYPGSETAFDRLATLAAASGDGLRKARGCAGLGSALHRAERAGPAIEALETAASLFSALGEQAALAQTLIEIASIQALTLAQYDCAEAAGEQALALARDGGDQRTEAQAELAMANSLLRSRGPEAMRTALEPARGVAIASGDLPLAAEICAALANSYYWTGHLRRSAVHARRRLELATAANDVFGLRHAHSWLALLAVSRGDWGKAQSYLDSAGPVLARLPSPEPMAFLQLVDSLMAFRIGDYERARDLARQAIRALEPLGDATCAWYAGLLVLACVRAGSFDEAAAEIEAQEARLDRLPVDALPARSARCALGLAYAELGDVKRGARCEEALRPFASDFHWSPARLTLAALAALRGDVATALEDLAAAETLAREEGQLPDLGLILAARAALTPGESAGRAAASEAGQIFNTLGMAGELALLTGRQQSRKTMWPAGLTRREVEVLVLVAEGLSNRQIAARLVLSERTVVNHLTHIFTKVGVENRAGATAFALRHGLA